jgi:hypothetical protein
MDFSAEVDDEPAHSPLSPDHYIALLAQTSSRHPDGRLTRIAHGQQQFFSVYDTSRLQAKRSVFQTSSETAPTTSCLKRCSCI